MALSTGETAFRCGQSRWTETHDARKNRFDKGSILLRRLSQKIRAEVGARYSKRERAGTRLRGVDAAGRRRVTAERLPRRGGVDRQLPHSNGNRSALTGMPVPQTDFSQRLLPGRTSGNITGAGGGDRRASIDRLPAGMPEATYRRD